MLIAGTGDFTPFTYKDYDSIRFTQSLLEKKNQTNVYANSKTNLMLVEYIILAGIANGADPLSIIHNMQHAYQLAAINEAQNDDKSILYAMYAPTTTGAANIANAPLNALLASAFIYLSDPDGQSSSEASRSPTQSLRSAVRRGTQIVARVLLDAPDSTVFMMLHPEESVNAMLRAILPVSKLGILMYEINQDPSTRFVRAILTAITSLGHSPTGISTGPTKAEAANLHVIANYVLEIMNTVKTIASAIIPIAKYLNKIDFESSSSPSVQCPEPLKHDILRIAIQALNKSMKELVDLTGSQDSTAETASSSPTGKNPVAFKRDILDNAAQILKESMGKLEKLHLSSSMKDLMDFRGLQKSIDETVSSSSAGKNPVALRHDILDEAAHVLKDSMGKLEKLHLSAEQSRNVKLDIPTEIPVLQNIKAKISSSSPVNKSVNFKPDVLYVNIESLQEIIVSLKNAIHRYRTVLRPEQVVGQVVQQVDLVIATLAQLIENPSSANSKHKEVFQDALECLISAIGSLRQCLFNIENAIETTTDAARKAIQLATFLIRYLLGMIPGAAHTGSVLSA
jgi:hypothetical protein